MFDIEYYNRYNQRIFTNGNAVSEGIPVTGAISDLLYANLPPNLILVSSASGKVVASSGDASKVANLNDTTGPIGAALAGKEPTLSKGNLTEVTSSVLTITGGTGAVIGSGASIQVKQATGAQAGYLSSADWNTFNSKLSASLANGNIWIGDGGGLAQPRSVSGDVSITNLGVVTITPGAIDDSKISGSAAIQFSKMENLTVDRALISNGSGDVSVSAVTATELGLLTGLTGGTVQSQLAGKLSATITTPALGDLLYYNGSSWVNFPRGSSGQILSSNATTIQWINSSSNVPAGGAINTVLRKVSAADYDTGWVALTASLITDITASATQINALATGYYDAVSSVQNQINSKLSKSLTLNHMFVGNSINEATTLAPGTNGYVLTSVGGVPTWVSPGSGGTVTSVAASGGTTGMSFGGSPITISGTLTLTGTLSAAHGGTGQSAYTVGDILYASTTTALSKLAAGTLGYVLTSNGPGVAPSWQAASGGGGGHDIENSGTPLPDRANLNFTNGLTASDNTPDTDVELGGTLIKDTSIDGFNDWQLNFVNLASGTFSADDGVTGTGVVGVSPASVSLEATSSGDIVNIQLSPGPGQFIITDDRATPTGIQYTADYSANFTARSLVDKGYADTKWSLATGGTLTGNNTITMGSNTITFTGNRVSFTPNATVAGINVGNSGAANPSTLVAGDIWYSSGNDLLWTRKGGSSHYMVLSQTGGSNTRIPYFTSSDNITGSANFTYDATNGLTSLSAQTQTLTTTTSSTVLQLNASGSSIGVLALQSSSVQRNRLFFTNTGTYFESPLGIGAVPGTGTAFGVTQGALAASWGPALRVTPGAHTSMTAATEFISNDFAGASWQWLAGTVATQRFNYFRGFTVTGASATNTITNAYTVYIEPSTVGANAAITNNYGFGVVGSVNASIRNLISNTSSGASAESSIRFLNDSSRGGIISQNSSGGGGGLGANNSFNINTSDAAASLFIGAGLTDRISIAGSTGRVSITSGSGFTVTQSALSSSWVTSMLITPGAHTAIANTTEHIDFDFGGGTVTQTWAGGGTVTTQRQMYVRGRTLSAPSAQTFSDAYTVYIDPPVAAGSATITRRHALGLNGNLRIPFNVTATNGRIYVGTGADNFSTTAELTLASTSSLAAFQNWSAYSNNGGSEFRVGGNNVTGLDISNFSGGAVAATIARSFVRIREGLTSSAAGINYTSFSVIPTWNTTGSHTGNLIAYDYNPTITTMVSGVGHYAFRSTSGGVLLAGGLTTADAGATITANTKLDVRGIGTTSTTFTQRWAGSDNAQTFSMRDDGLLFLGSSIFMYPSVNVFNPNKNARGIGIQATGTTTTNVPIVAITQGTDADASGNKTTLLLTNASLTPSSGTLVYRNLEMTPTYSITGGTTTVYGIDYNPTTTSMTGVTHYSFRATSGTMLLPASIAGAAPLRIPHGTAPSSPVDGDIWSTTAGLYVRINGTTVGPLGAGGSGWAVTGNTTLTGDVQIQHVDANELSFINTTNNSRIWQGNAAGLGTTYGYTSGIHDLDTGVILAVGDYMGNTTTSGGMVIDSSGAYFTLYNNGGSEVLSFTLNNPESNPTEHTGINASFTTAGNNEILTGIIGTNNIILRATSADVFNLFAIGSSANATTGATNQTIRSFGDQGTYTYSHTGGIYIGLDINPTFAGAQQSVATKLAIRTVAGTSALIGGTTITAGDVLLDLQSTSKALVVTRFAGDVATPVNGMIHYNTTSNTFRFRSSAQWASVGGGTGTSSFLIGDLVTASGTNALAFGYNTTANGTNTVSIGANAGTSSGTLGLDAISIGKDANYSQASVGIDSIAVGAFSHSGGTNSIAIGAVAYARGAQNVSIGYRAGETTGTHNDNAISIGYHANSDEFGVVNIGSGSTAIGNDVGASATGAIAMGRGTTGVSLMSNSTADSFGLGWESTTPTILFAKSVASYINHTAGFVIGGNTITAGDVLLDLQSTSKALVITRFAGDVTNPVDGMLHYNTTSNALRARINGAWVSLGAGGGGGISNSAAANEMMKSDGTNAVASGIFSTVAGNLTLGTGLTGATRTITADGSAADITVVVVGKGSAYPLAAQYGSDFLYLAPSTIIGTPTATTLDILTWGAGGSTNSSHIRLQTGVVANGVGGSILLAPGAVSGSGSAGNVALNSSPSSVPAFQSMQRGIFMGNAAAAPTGNPASGLFKWVDSAEKKMKVRDEDGEIYSETPRDGTISVTFDSTISAGEYIHVRVPYAGKFVSWEVTTEDGASSSVVVDVRKGTYASTFPLGAGGSIAGTEKPTLSSAAKNQDTTLSTWTTAFSAGDYIALYIDSVSGLTGKLHVTLKTLKNS